MIERNPDQLTNFDQLFSELDAGSFAKRIAIALSDTALGVVATGDKRKKGKVILTFDITRVGESGQVEIDHTLEYKKPTLRGTASETHTTSTPMYVGTRGKLTALPQTPDLFTNTNSQLEYFPANH